MLPLGETRLIAATRPWNRVSVAAKVLIMNGRIGMMRLHVLTLTLVYETIVINGLAPIISLRV